MLTKHQHKFLKKLLKKDITCQDLAENFDPVYMYLLKKDFIEDYTIWSTDGTKEVEIPYCKISEEGKVELELYKESKYRFYVPTILSIIAIITSFMVVFTQNGELWQWLKGLLPQ